MFSEKLIFFGYEDFVDIFWGVITKKVLYLGPHYQKCVRVKLSIFFPFYESRKRTNNLLNAWNESLRVRQVNPILSISLFVLHFGLF